MSTNRVIFPLDISERCFQPWKSVTMGTSGVLDVGKEVGPREGTGELALTEIGTEASLHVMSDQDWHLVD
jgi:hypothetical protein